MKKRIFKVHRGVDNALHFKIVNPDYKLQDVGHLAVKAKLVSYETKEKVFERYLRHQEKGRLVLDILEGDLVDVAPGYYEMVLQAEENQLDIPSSLIAATPFYTDTMDNITLDVEVTGLSDSLPQPTIELNPKTWLPTRMSDGPTYSFFSSAVPANSIRNHKNSVHTFAVYAENYSGTLEVLGSLEVDPESDPKRYFTIDLGPDTNKIEFVNHTGIDAFTFTANVVWIKFKLTPDPEVQEDENGSVTKILWRS